MKFALGLALSLLMGAAACSAAPSDYERARAGTPVMEATVAVAEEVAGAPGRYDLTLKLRDEAPVWIFLRSGLARDDRTSWRAQSWKVITDGVELVRIGHHEALVASDGGYLPPTVEIAFTPYERMLEADYQPAVPLGEATALFSDHFTLRPAASVAAVQSLGADWTMLPDYAGGHPLVRFREGFHHGSDEGPFALEAPAYVVHGEVPSTGNRAIAMRVHPGVPDWLTTQLETEIPAILGYYADRLGPHDNGRPDLFVTWAGPTQGTVSLGGSVIDSQIVMRLEGEGLAVPSTIAGRQARQFIAHEAAHFWLGNLVDYGRPGDAWTSEGGADLLALRATQAVDAAEGAALEARTLRSSWRECLRLGAGGPLASAPERGAGQAFYGCGFLFGLVAEKAARDAGGDFFSFWSGLIDRHGGDGTVSAEEWLRHYVDIGGNQLAAARMRGLAFNRATDAEQLETLFAAAGLTPPEFQP
ncbi:hypothetical protein [Sphingomicrobium aestuariivivum]|uniref:hypothetical protein n=1 Tax=Sphingomicrobium aestuariivivum TaxID=1582356 RepID=UPI001FD701B9|nr:hypothetical protein [Sphingomicrobium aestuariivivum]MCJ8190913.1 hypothetical protein [Sphingomicrobium aestuariivivum]